MKFSSVVISLAVALIGHEVQGFAPNVLSSSVVRSTAISKEFSRLRAKGDAVADDTSADAKIMIDEFRNNLGNSGNGGSKKVCLERMDGFMMMSDIRYCEHKHGNANYFHFLEIDD